jgi:hypothetical protein
MPAWSRTVAEATNHGDSGTIGTSEKIPDGVYSKRARGLHMRRCKDHALKEMNESADYAYDVFFSYKRHGLTIDWTRNFQKQLEFWLSQEIGRAVDMFVDVDTIEIGDQWPVRLQEAIRLSRCMVCVWSPMYFQSSWCVSEWKSFLEREKIVNVSPHGLIAPIRFHDGDYFPEEAQQVQSLDLRPFASTLPAFWNSPRSVELEDQIKLLAVSVAKMLKRVPPFRTDWPAVERLGSAAPTIPLSRL